METRRSKRLGLKENSKPRYSEAAPTDTHTVSQKTQKSSYFDPDFSEKSDSASNSPPTKRKPPLSRSRKKRKSKVQNSESESESSSNEFIIQKPKSFSEILQSQSELKLSSDESDSSTESLSKRRKKPVTPVKKTRVVSNTSSNEFVEPDCKTEPSSSDVNNEPESKLEYFDFTALVNKVKANAEMENDSECQVKTESAEPVENKIKKIKKPAKEKPVIKTDLEVCELLALGEDTDLTAKDIKESVSQCSETNYEIPKQVEVMVEAPTIIKKKKGTDLEMALRRRLNFIKRENQVYIHKVHILCWIAHGRHVNIVLNSPDVLSLALSLLPSDKCYPPKRMDMKYLEDLIAWFAKKVKIKKDAVEIRKEPLLMSLQEQFKRLEADSKNDLCFMFICIVRALGVKCRLIINLNVLPLKPTSDQLLPINTTKDPTSTSSKQAEKKSSHSKSKFEEKKVENSFVIEKKSNQGTQNSKESTKKSVETESIRSIREKRTETPKKEKEPSKSTSSKSTRSKSGSKNRSDTKEETKNEEPPKKATNVRFTRSKSTVSSKQSDPEEVAQKEIPSSKASRSRSSDSKTSNQSGKEMSSLKSRSKSSNSKKQSEYFGQEILNSRRSQRLTNSKSNYFPEETSKTKKDKTVKKTPPSKILKSGPSCSVEEMSSSDESESETFIPAKKKKIDRRVLSSEEDAVTEHKPDQTKNKNKTNYWIEVFLEAEEKWFCVDLVKKSYHCDQQLYNGASHPVRYVLAFNNDLTIKDVTKRYVPQYLSVTRKQRVEDNWWQVTMDPYKPSPTPQNREEDEELDRVLEEQPLPTAISEYKNHPLYALERHLLKFQAIYPANAPTLGYIKGEPVFSRLCVHQLHGREMWIKEAKVVKLGEKPYKVVKGRQKKDKFGSGEAPKDLELFGLWQTEDYTPPVAENGMVPRNSFGNVELFKPCMLPKGTVYLQIPGLQKIANKLNIDCAAAITGFEYSTNGWSYPVKDGFVVCEEYKDILLDAYNQEVEEAEKKERRKREERVWANWKRLIKGLFIREKLKRRYNFGDAGTSDSKMEPK